jgi:hypothetical protein
MATIRNQTKVGNYYTTAGKRNKVRGFDPLFPVFGTDLRATEDWSRSLSALNTEIERNCSPESETEIGTEDVYWWGYHFHHSPESSPAQFGYEGNPPTFLNSIRNNGFDPFRLGEEPRVAPRPKDSDSQSSEHPKGFLPLHGGLSTTRSPVSDESAAGKPNRGPSAHEILKCLTDETCGETERRRAAIMAALSSFAPSDRPALCEALRDFVLREIFHEEQTDIVATGAAVRAWARETTVEGLAAFTEFLVAGASQAPPIEVEVEMLKGICGRLVAAGQFDRTPLMPLENALWEIVDDYLRPGLIRRRKVAPLVVEAISALFMMQSDRRDELISRIQQLNVRWLPRTICSLLSRKLEQIKDLYDSTTEAVRQELNGVIGTLSAPL